MTNPLDMLFCVQRSFEALKEAACYYNYINDSVSLSFNDSVSIFLAVIISSDITEIVEIHQFISNLFNNDNLSPEVFAARATLESFILKMFELENENSIKKLDFLNF